MVRTDEEGKVQFPLLNGSFGDLTVTLGDRVGMAEKMMHGGA